MPVYNAAIPILEAYFKGVQTRLEREKNAEHAQILKDQLAAQKEHYKQQYDVQMAQNKVRDAKDKLEYSLKLHEGISKGVVSPDATQLTDIPTGVTPTGAKVQMPTGEAPGPNPTQGLMDAASQVFIGKVAMPTTLPAQGGAPAVNIGAPPIPQQIQAPTLSEAPPAAVAAPEMQMKTAIKPGAMMDGIDISRATLPADFNQNAANAARMKKEAEEAAAEPGRIAAREATATQKELDRNFRLEAARVNADAIGARLDKSLAAQDKWREADRNLRRDIANEANALRREGLILQRERNSIAREKMLNAKKGNDVDVSLLLPDVEKGVITREHIAQENDIKTRTQVMNKLREAGVVTLSNKQVDDMKNMQVVREFYERAKKLNEMVKNSNLWNPRDVARIKEEQAILSSILEPVAKGIGYKGAITNDEQARLESLIAKIVRTGEGDESALKFMHNFINSKVESILPSGHFTGKVRELQRGKLLNTFNVLLEDPKDKK